MYVIIFPIEKGLPKDELCTSMLYPGDAFLKGVQPVVHKAFSSSSLHKVRTHPLNFHYN